MGERKRDNETESDEENHSNNGMEWSVSRIGVTGKEVSETNRFRMQMLKYKIQNHNKNVAFIRENCLRSQLAHSNTYRLVCGHLFTFLFLMVTFLWA